MIGIIALSGNVKHPLTIDPSVWIFDDRKVDLTDYFNRPNKEKLNEADAYAKRISSTWDKELTEGSTVPPVNHSVKHAEKEKMLSGSFGMPLKPFLLNAEPTEHAESVVFVSTDGTTHTVSLEEALNGIVAFSKNGKPLVDDGPIHFYYSDGSNQENPIKQIEKIIVE